MLDHPKNGRGKGLRIARIDEQAGRPRLDEVRHSVHGRCDRRAAGRQCLGQRAAETLVQRGHDEDVEGRRDPGGVGTEPGEQDGCAELRRFFARLVLERAVTDHDEARVGPLVRNKGRHAHEVHG